MEKATFKDFEEDAYAVLDPRGRIGGFVPPSMTTLDYIGSFKLLTDLPEAPAPGTYANVGPESWIYDGSSWQKLVEMEEDDMAKAPEDRRPSKQLSPVHEYVSAWIELDSHSDLKAEHSLGGFPTFVRLELGKSGTGKTILRQKELTVGLVGGDIRVSRRSIVVKRFSTIDEERTAHRFDRYRIHGYWDPKKVCGYEQFDEEPLKPWEGGAPESDFLRGLGEIG